MNKRILAAHCIREFADYLVREEKSAATVEKYLRDVGVFMEYVAGRSVTKEITVAYKEELQARSYAVRSINSMIASLNSLLDFLDWTDCKVKALRCQRQIYCPEEKELTKAEYLRRLEASKENAQFMQQKLHRGFSDC